LGQIQRSISFGYSRQNATKVLYTFNGARNQKLDTLLDIRDSMSVLWACTVIGDDRNQAAYVVYNNLKARSDALPADVFAKMLQVCAQRGDGPMALEVVRARQAKGYGPLATAQLEDLLLAMAHSIAPPVLFASAGVHRGVTSIGHQRYGNVGHTDSKRGGKGLDVRDIDHYYAAYMTATTAAASVPSSGGRAPTRPSDEVFKAVAIAYSHTKRGDAVLNVLRDMTDASYAPSISFCNILLDGALFIGDTKVLRVLSSWYITNFILRLDHGVITRMLHVASAAGDGVLARNALKLLEKSGFAPSPSDYLSWSHACLGSDDVMGAVDALVAAHRQAGVDLLYDPAGRGCSRAGLALQDALATRLSRSVKRLDDVYYSLLEMLRAGDGGEGSAPAVPRLALNAVIMAAGRMGQPDRAYATFQEYHALFGLTCDTAAHNALLYATARSKQPSPSAMLSILQNMEDAGFQPDGVSYALLLEVMMETGNASSCLQILQHIEGCEEEVARGIVLEPTMQRAMRRMCVLLGQSDEWGVAGDVVRLMLLQSATPDASTDTNNTASTNTSGSTSGSSITSPSTSNSTSASANSTVDPDFALFLSPALPKFFRVRMQRLRDSSPPPHNS
jgi:hypothetical protein